MPLSKPFKRNEQTPDLFERLQTVFDTKMQEGHTSEQRPTGVIVDKYANNHFTAEVYSTPRAEKNFVFHINIVDLTAQNGSGKRRVILERHTNADTTNKPLTAAIRHY